MARAGLGASAARGWAAYRGPGIYDVKGSVSVMFWKLHHREERGRKGGECKFQKSSQDL